MNSLVEDLSDGVRLIQLMVRPPFIAWAHSHGHGRRLWVPSVYFQLALGAQSKSGDVSLGRYNRNPRLRIQKAENVNRALEFINSRGVKLTNIGPVGQSFIKGSDALFSHESQTLSMVT